MERRKRYCPFCGERLKMRTDAGRERLYCAAEDRLVYENPIPAATAIVTDTAGRILLVLRSCEPGAGQWALPGGFVENGESPAEAARRELEEETGLRGDDPQLVDVIHQESRYYAASLLIVGYRFARFEGVLLPADDAAEAKFFDPAELPALAFESHRRLIDAARLRLSSARQPLRRPAQPRRSAAPRRS